MSDPYFKQIARIALIAKHGKPCGDGRYSYVDSALAIKHDVFVLKRLEAGRNTLAGVFVGFGIKRAEALALSDIMSIVEGPIEIVEMKVNDRDLMAMQETMATLDTVMDRLNDTGKIEGWLRHGVLA